MNKRTNEPKENGGVGRREEEGGHLDCGTENKGR